MIDILIDHFDAVGVDRQRRLMGQVMKRGLQISCENGELHFDRLLPSLRKFAAFRTDDDALRELLSLLEGIDGLLISGAESFYQAEDTVGEAEAEADAAGDSLFAADPDDGIWLEDEELSEQGAAAEDSADDDPEDDAEESAEEGTAEDSSSSDPEEGWELDRDEPLPFV